MKVKSNGMVCDTKVDWGYKTDADFINHLLLERHKKKTLVKFVRRLMNELPSNKDWLDPELEKLINELIKE
jgi:hypothetical protein